MPKGLEISLDNGCLHDPFEPAEETWCSLQLREQVNGMTATLTAIRAEARAVMLADTPMDHEMWRDWANLILLGAFGAGLTWAGVLLEWHGTTGESTR